MKLDERKFNIALARKEMNTSDLAKATGYSLNTIRKYATFKSNPTTKSLGKIARALDVKVEDLLVD